MAQAWAMKLYNTKAWQDLRWAKIIEQNFTCERCHKNFANNPSELIGHHTIELTPANINQPEIALNPSLIKIVCKRCHDVEHGRYGFSKTHEVTIVYGAPCSGKTTFVNQAAERGDIIVDTNAIYQAVSGCDMYDKPDNIRRNVMAVRDLLIEQVRMRIGHWNNAWIVGGYARSIERNQLASRLGARQVYIDTPQEECKARAMASRGVHGLEWCKYIDRWFMSFDGAQTPPT